MRNKTVLNSAGYLLVVLVICFCPSNGSADESRPKPLPQTAGDVFLDIRHAWLSGDPRALLPFIREEKTILSFDSQNIERGLYSRSQAYYVFVDLFQTARTTSFIYKKVVTEGDHATSPHAFAHRRYALSKDGSSRSDQIYIALVNEEHKWFITHVISYDKAKGHQRKNESVPDSSQ